MEEMYEALETGDALELADVIYNHAYDDSVDPEMSWCRTHLENLWNDKLENKWRVPILLAQMDKTVLKALIRNDIFFQHEASAEFQALLPSDYSNPQVVYINAAVLRSSNGYFPCASDLETIYQSLDTYLNVDIRQRKENDHCKAIQSHATDAVMEQWREAEPELKKFKDVLKARIWRRPNNAPHEMDETENQTPSKQAILYTRYGDDGQVRMRQRDFDKLSLTNSCATYSIFACVCKAHNIKIEAMALPVLTICDAKDRDIAEILIARLTGSMYLTGGFNLRQPGGMSKVIPDNDDWLEKNQEEMYKDDSIFWQNLQNIQTCAENRKETVKTLRGVINGDLAKATEAMVNAREEFRRLDKVLADKKAELTSQIETGEARVQQLELQISEVGEDIQFCKNLEAWLAV